MEETKTALLDKAMTFAIQKHSGSLRRGKTYPYSVHLMEAVSIAATMTSDQELLAAAALHDVLEDTDVTREVLEREFGMRVADLVSMESDAKVKDKTSEESWKERKQQAINRLSKATRDEKIVALSDKLSNIRAIDRDYRTQGNEFWNIFHEKNPNEHRWHYEGLAESLKELQDLDAYQEFVLLVNRVFQKACNQLVIEKNDQNRIRISGDINENNADILLHQLDEKTNYTLDFSQVGTIGFSGLRALLRACDQGKRFCIVGVNEAVYNMFQTTGVGSYISVLKKPDRIDLSEWEEFGGGAMAVSYNRAGGESMMKLYGTNIPPDTVEREKRLAQSAMLCGIRTPMTGNLITDGTRMGVEFERIQGKRSLARAMSQEPEHVELYGKIMAEMTRKLHETPCNTGIFPDRELYYREILDSDLRIDVPMKNKIYQFLDSVEKKKTCLHGDLHAGNIIITEKDALFIDMADFSYGNPWYDIGILYFSAFYVSEERCKNLYHIEKKTMQKFWRAFAKAYFHANSEEELQEAEKRAIPFAGLTALFYLKLSGRLSEDLKQAIQDAFGKE